MICVKCIGTDEIISLHSKLISQSGGLDGIRYALETLGWGLADGSINEPQLLEWIVSHS